MKCVLSILLGVFLAGTAAANPIRNSSFELDSANFGVVRFARSGGGYLKPEFDSASAVHGRQSIRFANPKADMIEFLSAEFKLEPGKLYAFLVYEKRQTGPYPLRSSLRRHHAGIRRLDHGTALDEAGTGVETVLFQLPRQRGWKLFH